MKSVGIDVASSNYAALALSVDGKPTLAAVWKPKDKKDSQVVHLVEFDKWLNFKLGLLKPDIIAVEELAVFLNKKVIRALSRFEGVALRTAKRHSRIVLSVPVTQARGVIFDKGNISKDDAWGMRDKFFSGFDFGAKTSGGVDKMDAMTHSLAGPVIAERR